MSHRDDLNVSGDTLRGLVASLQFMNIYSKALLINAAMGDMTDDDYHQFLKDTEEAKPPTPDQPMVAKVFEGITETVGMIAIAKCIFGFGKVGFNALRSWASSGAEGAESEVAEMFSEAAIEAADEIVVTESGELLSTAIVDAASEAGAEAGTEVGIEATGAAIEDAGIGATSTACSGVTSAVASGAAVIVALGIDMIIGAIEGDKESKALDAQTANLENALNKLDAFINKVKTDITTAQNRLITEITNYVTAMKQLDKIQKANCKWDYPIDLQYLKEWQASASDAANQYLYLTTVRNDFENYVYNWNQDNPDDPFKKTYFKMWMISEITERKPPMTKEQAQGFIAYVAGHSDFMAQYYK